MLTLNKKLASHCTATVMNADECFPFANATQQCVYLETASYISAACVCLFFLKSNHIITI